MKTLSPIELVREFFGEEAYLKAISEGLWVKGDRDLLKALEEKDAYAYIAAKDFKNKKATLYLVFQEYKPETPKQYRVIEYLFEKKYAVAFKKVDKNYPDPTENARIATPSKKKDEFPAFVLEFTIENEKEIIGKKKRDILMGISQ